jgi:hypothetical protein
VGREEKYLFKDLFPVIVKPQVDIERFLYYLFKGILFDFSGKFIV